MEDQAKIETPEPQPPAPDSRKIKIRRVVKMRQASGPDGRLLVDDKKQPVMERDPDAVLTALSYARAEKWDTATFDAGKDEFEVDAVLATAAIETGLFKQSPETKTKLKNLTAEDLNNGEVGKAKVVRNTPPKE